MSNFSKSVKHVIAAMTINDIRFMLASLSNH